MSQLRRDASQEWREMLRAIVREGSGSLQNHRAHEPRSRGTMEILGYQSRWDMRRPAIACPTRKLGYRFMAAEPAWIIRGSNRLAEIVRYAKHLSTFSDDGVHLNGSYGPPFVEQLPYVVEALRSDPHTRQAVATFWRPRPGKWKDVPCTVALQWIIRRDHDAKDGMSALHCVATMRSSDAWLGIPYDVATFSALSAYVALLLRDSTAKSSDASELWSHGVFALRLGTLVLTCGSEHLYQRDLDGATACVEDSSRLFDVRPLDLDEFASPTALLDHLTCLADREPTDHRWLVETRVEPKDKATPA